MFGGGGAAGGGGGATPSPAAFARARAAQLREGPPGGATGSYEKTNFVEFTGQAVGTSAGWKMVGPYPGPVLLVPYLSLPADVLIAHPYEQPPITDVNGLIFSRGYGLLYLPMGGIPWAVKYGSAAGDSIRCLVVDCRNPNVLAWYMGGIGGASKRVTPTSVTCGAASTQIIAANTRRTALMLELLTGPGSVGITWGAAASYVAGPPIVTNCFVLSFAMGPLLFTEENLIREAVNGIRVGGTDMDVAVSEWVD